jgi:uridine kinase
MKYIAIDGRGGSGKTYLAEQLAERLPARVLHLDDFGNDYEPFIGIPKLIEAIEKSAEDTIIFEGVGVFDERFDRFKAFRIFVNTDLEVRKSRAAGRDVPRTDRTAEDWREIYEIWRKAEADYFSEARVQKANYVTSEGGMIDFNEIADAFVQWENMHK